MKKIVFFTLVSLFVLLLSSCDDSNPVSTQENLDFTLTFSQDKTGESNNILVTFVTNDYKNPPTIVINGYQMDRENYNLVEIGRREYLQAQKVIPYSDLCSYSVIVKGKTTSGSIKMPVLPKRIVCNGIELKNNSFTSLKLTDSLEFSWSSDSANTSYCYLRNNNYYKMKIADFETALFTISDSISYDFSIKSINASYYHNADYKPDNLEYYDEAIIVSETNFNRYSIAF